MKDYVHAVAGMVGVSEDGHKVFADVGFDFGIVMSVVVYTLAESFKVS